MHSTVCHSSFRPPNSSGEAFTPQTLPVVPEGRHASCEQRLPLSANARQCSSDPHLLSAWTRSSKRVGGGSFHREKQGWAAHGPDRSTKGEARFPEHERLPLLYASLYQKGIFSQPPLLRYHNFQSHIDFYFLMRNMLTTVCSMGLFTRNLEEPKSNDVDFPRHLETHLAFLGNLSLAQ